MPLSTKMRAPVARATFGRVDADSRSILGVAVVSRGEALGHGLWLDSAFLDAVVAAGNASPKGLKARFTHPDMFSDGMGSYLGRISNLKRDGDIVRGDLQLAESASKSPKGDLAGYVLSLAQEDPESFGLSIVFERDLDAEMQFMEANQSEEGDFASPDADNANNFEHARLATLSGCDVVDEPAANPKGLFAQLSELLSRVPPFSFVIGGNMEPVKTEEIQEATLETQEGLENCPECGQEMPEEEESKAEAAPEDEEAPKEEEAKASADSARIDALEAGMAEIKEMLAKLAKPKASGTAPVPFSGDQQNKPQADFMSMARDYAKANNIDIVKAMSHIAAKYPEVHQRYIGR